MALKISFSLPNKSDFIILYKDQAEQIKKYLFDGRYCLILDINTYLCLNPLIIIRILGKFICSFDRIKLPKKNVISYLVKELYVIHLNVVIRYIAPKIVVTFIDNSRIFQKLSQFDNKSKYFSIQNGGRTVWCANYSLPPTPHPDSVISMPFWFCIGQRDVDLFQSYGHKIEKSFPVGSWNAGIYREHFPFRNTTDTDTDICLVSSWHDNYIKSNLKVTDRVKNQIHANHKAQQLLSIYLTRFIRDTNRTVRVALRENNNQSEINYYKQHFGDLAIYVNGDREDFSTYKTMDRSNLTLTVNSTCGLDALSWGGKVLFFNPFQIDFLSYSFPKRFKSIMCFDSDSYESFKLRLNELLIMSEEDFSLRVKNISKHWIVKYDPKNPPHQKIKKLIMENT